jgi:hypothetical protein
VIDLMFERIQCPECQHVFEPSSLLQAEFERKLLDRERTTREAAEKRLQRELADAARLKDAEMAETTLRKDKELDALRGKVKIAADQEADLLKRARELQEREEGSRLELERKLSEETQRIREESQKASDERLQRELADAARLKDAEMAETTQRKDKELDALRGKVKAAADQEADLLKRARELQEREEGSRLELERKLSEETQRIREESQKSSNERLQRELAEAARLKDAEMAETTLRKDKELDALRGKVKVAVEQEAEFLKLQQALKDREDELRLDHLRKVNEEREAVKAQMRSQQEEAQRIRDEEQRLKDEEKRQTIEGMQKTIETLRQKAHQGSVQLQGEAQEVVLLELLETAFSLDVYEEVAKGVSGADILQRPRELREEGRGELAQGGKILWESKRTRNWSRDWLPKLRQDQRAAGADVAVLVTQALPAGIKSFGVIDGVWVVSWNHVIPFATVLRGGVLQVAVAQQAAEGQSSKVEKLYRYLMGNEFKNRITGVVEAFEGLQKDLEAEKRMLLSAWKKREKRLGTALSNMAAFYGDIRALGGSRVAEIPAFEGGHLLLADEGDPTSAVKGPIPLADPTSQEFLDLLLELVPATGTVGNGALLTKLQNAALLRLGVTLDKATYELARDKWVAEGKLVRRPGRGGAVARTS